MVTVPNYEHKVGVSHTPTGYYTTKATPDAFGASIARSTQQLGEASLYVAQTMQKLQNSIVKTNVAAFSNYMDQLEVEMLADPKNGYYSKLGKDAMANPEDPMSGANGVLSEMQQRIDQKQKELGLASGFGARAAEATKASKWNTFYKGAMEHEIKQTRNWSSATMEETKNAAINKGIINRNNEGTLALALGNGRAAILSNAKMQGWDEDTTRINLAKYTSDFHSGIINAYLEDGSLKANEYYEKHKEELTPDAQAKYLGMIKDNELKYIARSTAERLFNLYPENQAAAFAEVDKIENEKERSAIETRLTAMYSKRDRIENDMQDKLLNDMYDNMANKLQSGQILSEDDIPYGLNGKNWLAAKKAIEQLNEKGDIDTNNEMYLELYEMRNTDAQKFANMDLTQYRAYLSNSDYKAFQKMQVDIKNMTPTQISDQDAAVKNAMKSLGYTYNKQGQLNTGMLGDHTKKDAEAFQNSAEAFIREKELKRGKKLTESEIKDAMQEFASSWGYSYKRKDTADLYQEGMNKQVGFMRNLLNDFAAAEKAKGSPLNEEEKHKIIAERVSKTVQEDNKELAQVNVSREPKEGDIWNGHRITSVYGKRTAPTKGASTNHKGIDLAYKNNEPFNAFASGKVVKVAYSNSYGNYVDIKSEDGTIHRYAHANSISVKEGQEVTTETRLGRAGSTGISTGSHLHYEKIKDGKNLNPLEKQEKKPAAIAEGTIIKHQKTGQRMIMRGGKWQAI